MEMTTTPAALHQNGSAVNSAGAGAVNSGANGATSGANGAQSAQAKMDLGERKALWESLVCNFHCLPIMSPRVSQKTQKSEFWFATNPTGFHRLDEPPEKISAL